MKKPNVHSPRALWGWGMLFSLAVSCATVPDPWENFKPETGTAIVGRVVDTQARPIQSAQVSTDPDTDTEFTNAEGYFAIVYKRTGGGVDQPSSVGPLLPTSYQLLVDKALYLPLPPVPVRYEGDILNVGVLVLTPEEFDLGLDGFRPTNPDPVLPSDATDPKRE